MAGKRGRPSKKTPKLLDDIIAWIEEGKTLRDWCREDGNPKSQTVYRWMEEDEEFSERFARARADGHDAIANDCLDIADGTGKDVARDKLRVWTRLQLLSKWDRRYSDRQKVEHEGGLTIEVVTGVPETNERG
jgi:hypothetical protein